MKARLRWLLQRGKILHQAAELRLDELITRGNPAKSFKPLPQFPASLRDVAMPVPEATTHDAVLLAIKQAKPANLESQWIKTQLQATLRE